MLETLRIKQKNMILERAWNNYKNLLKAIPWLIYLPLQMKNKNYKNYNVIKSIGGFQTQFFKAK